MHSNNNPLPIQSKLQLNQAKHYTPAAQNFLFRLTSRHYISYIPSQPLNLTAIKEAKQNTTVSLKIVTTQLRLCSAMHALTTFPLGSPV
jgi:hypothetical protein